MGGIGITFAGGGGKGAYQIGVWKYLREIGLDKKIAAVSGTSVGALNAALFASGNFEKSEQLWSNISNKQILKPFIYDKMNFTDNAKRISLAMSMYNPLLNARFSPVMLKLIETRLVTESFFSTSGLRELIEEGVDFLKIRKGKMPCYVTCTEIFPQFGRDRHNIQECETSKDAMTLLLASAAFPVAFEPVSYKNKRYYDGGIEDNVPIDPLLKIGIKKTIVIYLDNNPDPVKDPELKKKLVEIIPSENLGGLLKGTMNFDAEYARRLIELGYQDAKYRYGNELEKLLSNTSRLHWYEVDQGSREIKKKNGIEIDFEAIGDKLKNKAKEKIGKLF